MKGPHAGVALLALFATLGPGGAWAEYGRIPPTAVDPKALAIDEAAHLGQPLDGAIELIGADGAVFRLADLFDKPLILVLSYYRCDGSCPTLNRNLARAVRGMRRLRPGADFRVLTVSFDRKDDAERLSHFLRRLGPIPEGWRYAVFKRPEDLEALTASLGYKFYWSVRDRVFLHPNVLIFVTPEGRVARYLYGLSLRPRDVELALIGARQGNIARAGQIIDFLTALCFSYSFSDGRYVLNYPLFIAAGSLALGAGLVAFSFTVYRRRKPRRFVHV